MILRYHLLNSGDKKPLFEFLKKNVHAKISSCALNSQKKKTLGEAVEFAFYPEEYSLQFSIKDFRQVPFLYLSLIVEDDSEKDGAIVYYSSNIILEKK